jgi:hypothetical protein
LERNNSGIFAPFAAINGRPRFCRRLFDKLFMRTVFNQTALFNGHNAIGHTERWLWRDQGKRAVAW